MRQRRKLTLLAMIAPTLSALAVGCASQPAPSGLTYNAELEYLKTINEHGPPQDPRLAFLLMAEYLNANRHREGIELFESLLDQHEVRLAPGGRALYLSCLGILRADYAEEVPLLERVRWVEDTIELLEEARRLTRNEDFVTRFSTGVVYARLPDRFGKRRQAYRDLQWLAVNSDRAPEAGLLREIYFQLARLYDGDGDRETAERYLARSGYQDYDKPLLLLTSFAEDAETGHTFYPRKLTEVVPGKVFALSGFEFTEYYFVISDDGSELISIDAGTRPDSAEDAYRALEENVLDLPPLTTVFVTHAHWDHIGGHRFFRELNPDVTFYSRDNYAREFDAIADANIPFDWFFGARYDPELITDYRPDVTLSERTEVYVGGTRFELIPIPGGETVDGIFVYMPDDEVLFAGDFIMPFIGAPFFEEGNVPGLLEAMDIAVGLRPRHILHGHETLTRNWDSPQKLAALREQLAWLYEEVLAGIRAGLSRSDIHHLNLMPPTLLEHPEVQVVYLIMRENVVNRIYDRHVGYWHGDLTGLDHLSHTEYGAMLTEYFGLSQRTLARAVEQMLRRGDYHLAGRVTVWALSQYPDSGELQALRKTAFLKLKEKYQFTNPFKFIVYSELAGDETAQLGLE